MTIKIDSRKTGVAFWATVTLVVALVGYPLSFGPAMWAMNRSTVSPRAVAMAYRPVLWLWAHGPDVVADSIIWYGHLGSDGVWLVDPDTSNWIGY